MVTKETIRELEMESIRDYFKYIALSIVNGQRTQARNLISDLSINQKVDAIQFFDVNYINDAFSESKIMVLHSMQN